MCHCNRRLLYCAFAALTFPIPSPLGCNFGLDGGGGGDGEEEQECLRQMTMTMAVAVVAMPEVRLSHFATPSLSLLPQPLKRGASTSCLKHRLDGDDRWKPVYFRTALGFASFSCGGCVNPAGSQDAGFSPSLREGFASLSSLFPCSDNLPNAPEFLINSIPNKLFKLPYLSANFETKISLVRSMTVQAFDVGQRGGGATSERPLIVDLWVPRMLAGQFPLSPAQSSRAARNINYSYRVMILQGHYCYNFSQS